MDAAEPDLEYLLRLSDREREPELARMSKRQKQSLRTHWGLWARPGQRAPEGAWQRWLIMAGRGFGKTRAGAEWVRAVAENDRSARIALVAANLGEARAVMVEGESGVMRLSPSDKLPVFEPSKRLVTWPSGAQAMLYSAGEPESLRGPQHSHAWCDEIAKWGAHAEAAWDNLMLGLRLGRDPRLIATTTPRAVPLVRRLIADEEVAISRGKTWDNKDHLPTGFVRAVLREYGRSLLARQELDGELIEDLPGALWTRALLEDCREDAAPAPAERVVIGVDPPASAEGDACGIVVCARGADGIARVLADASITKPSPERWARAVAQAARAWNADRVVAEANQGGAMVASVLRAADLSLPLRLVHASRGKTARAEPVAALYEAGRARHAGCFPALEDELAGQAQKEAFVNEALSLADMLLHCAVQGEATAPPASPAAGDTWLVGPTPTGAWAGQAGKLAGWQGGNWLFAPPRDGMRLLDLSTGQDQRYRDGLWQAPETPPPPAGGSVVDAQARAAIADIVAALQQVGIFASG